MARRLGVSSAAAACSWTRPREKKASPMKDEPVKVSEDEPTRSGFDGVS